MRKFIIVILCACTVFVAGYAGYRAYQKWTEKRQMNMARQYAFAKKPDVANAVLCLRQVLQSNPNNVDACRMMADVAELAQAPQAVFWRKRVLELEPKAVSNHLAYARVVLDNSNPVLAQSTLDGLNAPDRNTAEYHELAGRVALRMERRREAEEHFLEAVRLDPTNAVPVLRLAALRLLNTNDSRVCSEARSTLLALATNGAVRCNALRTLASDAMARTNLPDAVGFSRELIHEANATFGDRLSHLEVLCMAGGPEVKPFLEALQEESRNHPYKAFLVARWMTIRDIAASPATEVVEVAQRKYLAARSALSWLETLPAETRATPPVPLIETECLLGLDKSATVLTNLATQNWGETDCLRLACRACAYKKQGQEASAKTEWIAAMRAVGNRGTPQLLQDLLRMTAAWGWPSEQEDVLWAIVNRYPFETNVVSLLERRLYNAGRTRSLLTLYSQLAQASSTNTTFINNVAMTALLLEAWDKKPNELAQQAYNRNSGDASCISTYAYSLLVQRKVNEALKTMETIRPEQLETPGFAAYYGIILTEAGHEQKARKYLDIAKASSQQLLPEERKLVEIARKRTGQT